MKSRLRAKFFLQIPIDRHQFYGFCCLERSDIFHLKLNVNFNPRKIRKTRLFGPPDVLDWGIKTSENERSRKWTVSKMDDLESGRSRKWTIPKVGGYEIERSIKWTAMKVNDLESRRSWKWNVLKVGRPGSWRPWKWTVLTNGQWGHKSLWRPSNSGSRRLFSGPSTLIPLDRLIWTLLIWCFSYGFGFGQRLSPEINNWGASFLSASKFRRVSS